MKRRILFVAMQNSPHAARWIDLIADQGWDLHLFPIDYLPVTPQMRGVTVHQPWHIVRPRAKLREFFRNRRITENPPALETQAARDDLPVRTDFPLPMVRPLDRILDERMRTRLGESEASAPLAYGPHRLARLIKRLEPDLIHSMEFQHCGYNVLRAKELTRTGHFPKWLATNWGSDIYYYRQFPEHRKQITRLLKNIDYYSCECERDVDLARELGFRADVMPVMPNTGGFDLVRVGAMRNLFKPSSRRAILVKGYQHFAGRALTALDAIEKCADLLGYYRIVIFSPSPEIKGKVENLRRAHGLDITLIPYTEHNQMLRMFADARIYLGVSISDAISTSMLEAMALGTFPIQTSTACCNEWIEDGKGGFIIPPDNVGIIAARLRRALSDDALVDRAAEINWGTVQQRLDKNILKEEAIAFYNQILTNPRNVEA